MIYLKLLVFTVVSVSFFQSVSSQHTVPDLVKKHGYPCEIHTVVTQDGYVLTLHRIPHGKAPAVDQKDQGASRPPVVMQHGFLSSSNSWVIDIPIKAPAYIMADAGYDVWLTNVRGNVYGKRHTHWCPKHKEFWQFSWDEMGYYDLPAFIDYVLEVTQSKQLYFIGHSMGTTIFFAGMSRRPEYNDKIKAMFALAPVGTVSHIRGPARYISFFSNYMKSAMEKSEEYEFMPRNSRGSKMFRWICGLFEVSRIVCENFLFFFVGYDDREINNSWIPAIEDGITSGTSLYTALHYSQEYLSGKFELYDYGPQENTKRYGEETPPAYNISDVTSSVHLIWGKNDYLADEQDIQFLLKHLPKIESTLLLPYDDFNHLDFIVARDIETMVYRPILEKMKRLSKNSRK